MIKYTPFYSVDADAANNLEEALDRAFAAIPQLQTGEGAGRRGLACYIG